MGNRAPHGSYQVHAVCGDSGFDTGYFHLMAEEDSGNEREILDGEPSSAMRFIEGEVEVTVSDGRLTLSSGPKAINNRICFVDITPVEVPSFSIASDRTDRSFGRWFGNRDHYPPL
jgi:hypothetical protein